MVQSIERFCKKFFMILLILISVWLIFKNGFKAKNLKYQFSLTKNFIYFWVKNLIFFLNNSEYFNLKTHVQSSLWIQLTDIIGIKLVFKHCTDLCLSRNSRPTEHQISLFSHIKICLHLASIFKFGQWDVPYFFKHY